MIALIAIATMIAATLAQHLGLAEAIARVVDKVASCPQCFTFWVTMSALLYLGYDVYTSTLAAIVVALQTQPELSSFRNMSAKRSNTTIL